MFSYLDALKKFILKERKFLVPAFLAGLAFTTIFCVIATSAYSDQVSGDIANELIRFHVRANSDSEEDQKLKEFVRDGVLDYLRGGLSASSSKSETCELLNSRLEDVKAYAESLVRQKGYDYNVEAKITREFFPTKVYGDIALPAGEYDTLRIDIGRAAGNNWWCVLFPPLCYVDITLGEIPADEKETLKSVLSPESYDLITKSDDLPVRIKFKTVELWQNVRAGNTEVYALETKSGKDSPLAAGPPKSGDAPAVALKFIKNNAVTAAENNLLTEAPEYVEYVEVIEVVEAMNTEDDGAKSEDGGGSTEEAEAAEDQSLDNDLWLLASVINGEARGEQYTGQVAVGAVVMNRVAHPAFPDTIEGVIYQPGAFDAVRDGQISLAPSESCLRAAKDALDGVDPTNGALYYWNPKTATCTWIHKIPVTIAIGNHNFGI